MNSKPITETWYTLRLARWLWRLVWNRRTAWTLLCFISLITVLWQWENWRSARELKEVHRRVVERLGTADPTAHMPPKMSDEENYFANPVFESWLKVTQSDTKPVKYSMPPDVLLPAGFIRPGFIEAESGSGETRTLDLDSWIKRREAKVTEPATILLARELGDGNGLLPKLAEGLNKPFSVIKPGQREALALVDVAGKTGFIDFMGLEDLLSQLGLHLRSAALVGDQHKVVTTALVMLRISEGSARGGYNGFLYPVVMHVNTFHDLHDALSHPAWTPKTLSRLQFRFIREVGAEWLR